MSSCLGGCGFFANEGLHGYCSVCAKRLATVAMPMPLETEDVSMHSNCCSVPLEAEVPSASLWVMACIGAATGNTDAVQKYVASGGSCEHQTAASDCELLRNSGVWVEPGLTLMDIALQRDCADVVMVLVDTMQSQEETQEDLVRKNMSTMVEELQRTQSLIDTLGDEDNLTLPNRVREVLLATCCAREDGLCHLDLPQVPCSPSFVLPEMVTMASPDAQSQALGLLIEAKDCLEPIEAMIGWWREHLAATMIPLYTSADLNCLLHSCSLAIAGVRDTLKMPAAEHRCLLREAVFSSLAKCPALLDIAQCPGGDESSVQSPRAEEILSLARRNRTALDGSHIFVLANVLRRPVICHAYIQHEGGEARHVLAVPFRMSGIYLPFLWDPDQCSPDPVVLAYTQGHFTALCPVREAGPSGVNQVHIPLYDAEGSPLPVPYAATVRDESGAASTKWMGWAGTPPAAALGASVENRDCCKLVSRYLSLSIATRGPCALLRLPADNMVQFSDSSRCSPLHTYRCVIGALVTKRLKQTGAC